MYVHAVTSDDARAAGAAPDTTRLKLPFFGPCLVLLSLVGCGDDGASMTSSSSGGAAGGAGAGGATTGGSTTATTSAGGAPVVECFDYSSFVPTPGVSFEQDIMPIFAASCNEANCHSNLLNPDGDLYLGEKQQNDAGILDEVHSQLVGVPAIRSTNLDRVSPGDPINSFLMIKIDGDLLCPQVTCIPAGCGARMPRGNGAQPLPPPQLDLVRSWIANGAPREDGLGGGGAGTGGGT